jgi:predicted nucleic acid-binding protein
VILVDSSVWVDHLRHGSERLRRLLGGDLVLTHPFVVGEVACGRLTKRTEILGLLARLPHAVIAEHDEVLRFVEQSGLQGGLGWVDVHLLASAVISKSSFWTEDRALARAAVRLGVSTGAS